MPDDQQKPLRILLADERPERLEVCEEIVVALGHTVVATEMRVDKVGAVAEAEHPDVALVAVGETPAHALGLIREIVAGSTCPVIALLPSDDRAFIKQAAEGGVFAYVIDAEPSTLQSSMEVVLLRFREYHGLEGAFGRRAISERAKGILMERHGIDEREAFSRLRGQARRTNRKLVVVAQAVIDGEEGLADP